MAMFDLAQMMGRMRGREGGFVGRPAPQVQEAPPPMDGAPLKMGVPGGFGTGITASLGQAMGPKPALPPITNGGVMPPPRMMPPQGGGPMMPRNGGFMGGRGVTPPPMPTRRPQMGPPTMGRRPMMRRPGGFGNGMPF